MRLRAEKLGWLFRLLVALTTVGLTIPAFPTEARTPGKSARSTKRAVARARIALGALAWLARPAQGKPALPARGESEIPLAPVGEGIPASESESESTDAPGEESPIESDDLTESMAWSGSSSAHRSRSRGLRRRGPTLAFDPRTIHPRVDGTPAPKSWRAPSPSASTSRELPTRLCRLTC